MHAAPCMCPVLHAAAACGVGMPPQQSDRQGVKAVACMGESMGDRGRGKHLKVLLMHTGASATHLASQPMLACYSSSSSSSSSSGMRKPGAACCTLEVVAQRGGHWELIGVPFRHSHCRKQLRLYGGSTGEGSCAKLYSPKPCRDPRLFWCPLLPSCTPRCLRAPRASTTARPPWSSPARCGPCIVLRDVLLSLHLHKHSAHTAMRALRVCA